MHIGNFLTEVVSLGKRSVVAGPKMLAQLIETVQRVEHVKYDTIVSIRVSRDRYTGVFKPGRVLRRDPGHVSV